MTFVPLGTSTSRPSIVNFTNGAGTAPGGATCVAVVGFGSAAFVVSAILLFHFQSVCAVEMSHRGFRWSASTGFFLCFGFGKKFVAELDRETLHRPCTCFAER